MKNYLTRLGYVNLTDLLREHCSGVDGRAVYDENWSDRVVFETFREKYPDERTTLGHVERHRSTLFGIIREVPRKINPDLRFLKIEKRLTALEKWASDPVASFKREELP